MQLDSLDRALLEGVPVRVEVAVAEAGKGQRLAVVRLADRTDVRPSCRMNSTIPTPAGNSISRCLSLSSR